MPLTPFHFGPGLFIGLLLLRLIDLPTFLVASVIVDIEPILVLTFDLGYRLHGFLHSFPGGTLVAFVLAVVMSKVRPGLSSLLAFFRLEQKTSFGKILLASSLGIYIHILLDSNMHEDIQPFYPLDFNPLLDRSTLPGLYVMILCFWSFIGALIVYALRLFLVSRKDRSAQSKA